MPDTPGLGVIVTSTGLVMPVREVRNDGYLVATPCTNETVVDFGTYVAGVDVVLDPGHGGQRDTGAVGANGLVERDLNMAVSELVRAELEARGHRVMLTRTKNIETPILTRAEIALALSPEVFVSIHHNGGTTFGSSKPGTEVFHQAHNPQSMRLAGILFEEVQAALSRYDVSWAATSNQGTRAFLRTSDGKDLFGILRLSEGVTTVVVEAAYLSNPPEARLLADPAVQHVEAHAIAAGIIRYLTTDDPGSGHNGVSRTSRVLSSGRRSGCVDPPIKP